MPIGRHKVAILADRATVKLLFALVLAATLCDPAGAVPFPRPRPDRAPAAPQPQVSEAEEPAPPSACRLRLTAELAVAPSLPALSGPGECGVDDAVRLEAVVLRDKTALDVRSFKLANGTVVDLTDPQVSKDYRLGVRKTTCARFTTVLGPGSDGYHENHVHMDLAERAGGHRMCQWDVRDPDEEAAVHAVPLPTPRPASAGP
jgi:hypothetical protein